MAKDDGRPADAVKAALCTVLSLMDVNGDRLGEKIDRILFAWDGEDKRDKGRAAKPPQYHQTRDLLKEYLSLMLSPTHACSRLHEADDVVATAVKQSDAENVFVVSGDKDLQQLADGERVHYYCLNQKMVLPLRYMRDKWNVKKPNQIAIVLAILGDKADLIDGIKGWGPKKVKSLFEQVTPEMDLTEALLAIEAQIPPKLLDRFYGDLDLTLLNPDIPKIPLASPVHLADMRAIEELHLRGLIDYYRPVYRVYHARRADAQGDTEDLPTVAREY